MDNFKKYKSKTISIISFIIFILLQLITLVPPIIMKNIVDEYIPKNSVDKIFLGIFLFVLIPFTYITIQAIFNYITIVFARKNGNKLSIDILSNLINQNKSFFDKNNSVELATYASKESVNYINFYVSELPKYYGFIITCVVIFGLILRYSIYLSLLQLFIIPLAIFPIKIISSKLDKNIRSVLENNAKSNQIRADIFKRIDTVKSLRIENQKIDEVKVINSKTSKIWGKIAALDMITGIWMTGFLSMLFTGLTFGIGAYIISQNIEMISIGELISILSLVSILYVNINNIFRTNIEIKKHDAENHKLFSYLTLIGEDTKDKINLNSIDSIKINKLSFSYNENKSIIKDFDFECKKGDFIGLIGKSGVGKSTIFNLLLKFYDVENNTIFYNDIDINKINPLSIRDNVTKISQQIDLFPGTIEYNLRLSNEEVSNEEIHEILKFVKLDNYISSLEEGINTDIGEAGKLMSGGEMQRLALAQGLLRKNKVLLLDEITSNIDKNTERIIRENILKLHNTGEYIIIAISHNKEFLEDCDKIYELK
ncbi:ABC transporter ATP-binding protein [Helcococcus ovis]|uniref:ABC transporter ATP-binding protein n=1 Tax=Helcococcus ovis TaxID=72026 RepID=UPI0010701EC3|nr:ABC transporter ATP-binding protein [Helcococcus ovis]TFF68693.1 ABC transporter ATP-binding protein [Helcococcus ovis]WNZ01634.1 ABC transporter ATP-binding protein [Helcococcus ovis]